MFEKSSIRRFQNNVFSCRFFCGKNPKQKIIYFVLGCISLFCLFLLLFSDRLFCFKITLSGDVRSADYADIEYTDFQSTKGIYISPNYNLCKIWIPVSGIQKKPMLTFYDGRKLSAEKISISFLRFKIKDLDQNEVSRFLNDCSSDNKTTRYPLEPILRPLIPSWCGVLLFLRPHASFFLIVILFLLLMKLCFFDSWSTLLKKFLFPQKASSCIVLNYVIRFCSALYFAFVFLFSFHRIGYLNMTQLLFLPFFLLFWGILNLLDFLLPDDLITRKVKHDRCWLWGTDAGVFAFQILFGVFLTCGGQMDVDPIKQIKWVQHGDYNDWHPFLHTLFLAGCLKIYDHFSCIVLIQMVLFAGAFGYQTSVLFRTGLSLKILIPVQLFVILNPQTPIFMMGGMKDSTLAVVIMVLAAQMIQIYVSGGKWLHHWKNLSSFALVLVLATLLRHNAFFFTVPCLLLTTVFFIKPKMFLCLVGIFFFTIFFVKGPQFHFIGVGIKQLPIVAEKRFFYEANGLPLTVVSAIYVNNPDNVSGQTRTYLDHLASPAEWEKIFTGHFNSIKFYLGVRKNTLQVPSLFTLYSNVFQAVCSNHEVAFAAVRDLTGMVWDPFVPLTQRQQAEQMFCIGNPVWESEAHHKMNEVLFFVFDHWQRPWWSIASYVLCWRLGFWMLFFVLAFTFGFRRNGSRILFLFLPTFCYNTGTMLLLSGPDVRFFFFNVLTIIPLTVVMLCCSGKQEEKQNPAGKVFL